MKGELAVMKSKIHWSIENFETCWCYVGKSAFQQELGQNESSSSEAELVAREGMQLSN
jgi:hypothetical protein